MLDPDVLYWTLSSVPEGEFFSCCSRCAASSNPLLRRSPRRRRLARILPGSRRLTTAWSGGDRARLLEPDLEFHRAIMAATHNDMLAYIGNMLSLALSESIRLTSRHPDTHALSLPRHKAILTAIQSRDPLGARQASLVQLESARVDADSVLEEGGGRRA